MNTININGKIIKSKGNIVIQNGKVMVGGEEFESNDKRVSITIMGDIKELEVDSCDKLTVVGNCGEVNTGSGDVEVKGNVDGNIRTGSGDVDVYSSVAGTVKTGSGDVEIHNR